MSSSLMISIAFLISIMTAYILLKNKIKDLLDNEHNKNSLMKEEIERFSKEVRNYYKTFSEKYDKLDIEINKIVDTSVHQANAMLEKQRQDMQKLLDHNSHINLKKVTEQIKKDIVELHINSTCIAASAVEYIISKNKDVNLYSHIISSYIHQVNATLQQVFSVDNQKSINAHHHDTE
ncbi:hypothetical protein [Wolbachia endosymbiont of Howardula sp.]|uniref:hypothetical protein n=1 Tax=Wolbachia endosymbiont of Howardula sp. TaxID=2916816 RepID=UPI00217D7B83|nr:hypothetical protein [Wolbachia endosymbiont of Howardula sp.]UWI83371.1 hypothetical protein MC061_01265 [Wolbachia endosymbiont of Howardula sp.]